MNQFLGKPCFKKVMTNKDERKQKQQKTNMLQFLGKKTPKHKEDEKTTAVKEFLKYFCEVHKDKSTVHRSDSDLYNEYYDWTMQTNRVGYGKPTFIAEVFKLQDDLPTDTMPLKREVNISLLTDSLLGKRKRE